MLVVMLAHVRIQDRHVGGDVPQRATERDVDQLAAAAHAEHGFAGLDELVQQLELVHVAHATPGHSGRASDAA